MMYLRKSGRVSLDANEQVRTTVRDLVDVAFVA